MRRTSLAAGLASIVFTTSVFVSIDFSGGAAQTGGFVVSADKMAAVVLMPLVILLLGHVRVSWPILSLAGVLIAAYTVALIPRYSGQALSAASIVFVGAAAATVLYTALCASSEPFRILGWVWIIFSAATSLISCLQATGQLSFLAFGRDASELETSVPGFVRATGLTGDPNYQAMGVVIGLGFTLVLLKGARRWALVPIHSLGLLATFSRMGMLLGLMLIAFAPVYSAFAARASLAWPVARGLLIVVAVALAGVFTYHAASPQLRAYFDARVNDTAAAFNSLGGQAGFQRAGRTSGDERAALFNVGVQIAEENWVSGVGAFRLREIVDERIGVTRSLHNTYIDTLAIGGLIGAAFLVGAGLTIGRAVRLRAPGPAVEERTVVALLAVSMALMAFVLSLSYNAVIWLPVVAACVYSRRWIPRRGLAWHM